MSVEETRFRNTPVDDLPRNQLLQLEEALIVGMSVMGQPGEFMIVLDVDRLPVELQHVMDQLRRRSGNMAFFTLKKGPLSTLIPLADRLRDGPGEVISAEKVEGEGWTEEGSRVNIAPDPVTASVVPPRDYLLHEIPQDALLALAQTYDLQTLYRGITHMHPRFDEQDDPRRVDDLTSYALDMALGKLRVRRGTPVEVSREGEQTFFTFWGNEKFKFRMDLDPDQSVLTAWPLTSGL